MLDTYTLTYLGPQLNHTSPYINADNPLLASSHLGVASLADNLEALAYRLPGAYGFFEVNKPGEEQYQCEEQTSQPANPPEKMLESCDNFAENPTCVTPSGVVCFPKGFQFTLVEDEEDEEFDSQDEEDYLNDDRKWNDEPEPPNQLLAFATSATNDIQRFFTRNKDNDDYCDIFEDKFKQIKSGQELYYRDLMAVAQFGDGEECKPKGNKQLHHNHSSCAHTVLTSQGHLRTCTLPHSGRLNSDVGLGPFQELFDSVLRDTLIKDEVHHPDYTHQEFSLMMKYSHTPNPLGNKKIPSSFWDESNPHLRDLPHSATTQTLDFSDLLAGWTNESVTYT